MIKPLKIAGFLLLFMTLAAQANAQTGVTPRTVCQSTCSGDLGDNIFPDGDFGQGIPNVPANDPGIAPGYTYTQSPPPNDGSYTITNSTATWGSFAASSWIKIGDNGPEPNGYMMVVNASYQPGLFYLKQVPVCENTLYEFSIDVISMNIPSTTLTYIKPNVAFEIDGVTVCSTDGVAVNGTWQTFRFSFLTDPGTTQVTLSLRNDAPGGFGNDLAIDNISFRACGPDINVPVTAFYCVGAPLTLNAALANSPYSPTFYQWQYIGAGNFAWQSLSNGNDLSHTVPQPKEGDKYRLVVASSQVNLGLAYCRAVSLPVDLMLDDLSDFAISGADTIVCNGAPAVLEAGAFAQYQWSTGAQSPSIEAPMPGWYAVTVTTANDCPGTDSLFVYEVDLLAEASAKDPHCFGYTDGEIQVRDVQGGSGTVYFSLNDGPRQTQMLFTNLAAGLYNITAIDSLGCQFPIPISLSNPPALAISIGEDQALLICDSLTLEATANFSLLTYSWQPPDGLSCVSCPAPIAMPLQTTLYSLTASDERGCLGTDSVRISSLPRLDVYAPNIFKQDISSNGINNSFTLFPSKSATMIRRFEVFDRWGEMVFSRENELPGATALHWDGLDFRGKTLDEGVFLWWAEIVFSDGRIEQYSGDVTLLRR